MREFKLLILSFTFLLSFGGCNPSDKISDVCPTCKMKIADSKLHSTSLHVNGTTQNFDDIGCMILFAKENQLNLNRIDTQVFANDTLRYIDASTAFYTTDENSPMGYGFSAYEKEKTETIKFSEVIIKMLRGEHMANPTIRKRTLGGEL